MGLLGTKAKKAVYGKMLEAANNAVMPKSIEIVGRNLNHPHDLHADVARVLFFEAQVEKIIPSYNRGKILAASLLKQWENTGNSQPYLDAVNLELILEGKGFISMDIHYYPSGKIWKACVNTHSDKNARFTYQVRRVDNDEDKDLLVEDVCVHRNIEHEWKIRAAAK